MNGNLLPQCPPCFYRVSAKAIIVINNKLLLIREASKRWDLPGGGVEHSEDLDKTLKRELKEELSVTLVSYDKTSTELWFSYDHDPLWERPNLNIVVAVKIVPKPNILSAKKGIECKLFSRNEIIQLPLEKNLEPFRRNLLEKLFGSI
jgi:8-oxo-dGTP pyrophosphatase MutT (NUDIX family)